jgi:hypothetical protein
MPSVNGTLILHILGLGHWHDSRCTRRYIDKLFKNGTFQECAKGPQTPQTTNWRPRQSSDPLVGRGCRPCKTVKCCFQLRQAVQYRDRLLPLVSVRRVVVSPVAQVAMGFSTKRAKKGNKHTKHAMCEQLRAHRMSTTHATFESIERRIKGRNSIVIPWDDNRIPLLSNVFLMPETIFNASSRPDLECSSVLRIEPRLLQRSSAFVH